MGEKVQERRSINGRYQIHRVEVKNSIGNEEAKELICTTHGHELRVGGCWREWGYWVEEGTGGKIRTTVTT